MKKILIFLCSILIFSCQEQVVELEIPGHTSFLVVNGILDTDSIMSLHVSNSVGAFQQGQISSISDANVLLYENNNLLGEMSVDFNTQDSIYILEQSDIGGEQTKLNQFTIIIIMVFLKLALHILLR